MPSLHYHLDSSRGTLCCPQSLVQSEWTSTHNVQNITHWLTPFNKMLIFLKHPELSSYSTSKSSFAIWHPLISKRR
jgi:hypothetical protein